MVVSKTRNSSESIKVCADNIKLERTNVYKYLRSYGLTRTCLRNIN